MGENWEVWTSTDTYKQNKKQEYFCFYSMSIGFLWLTSFLWASSNSETSFTGHATSIVKVWKEYHLNGARIPKPKREDDDEVLQSAETIAKALILNISKIPAQRPFAKNDLLVLLVYILHYKYTILNYHMIKKVYWLSNLSFFILCKKVLGSR